MSQPAAQRAHAEELVRKIVNALDDKKATDIRVIDITGKSSVADFLVVATGSADQHLRGMRIEVEKTLDEAGVKIDGVESQPESGWTVMGTFEVMIHLFRADQRANFRIEQLWKDGTEIPVAKFIKPVAKPSGFVDVSGNTKPAAAVKKAPAKKPVPVKAPMVKKALVSKLAATKAAVQAAAQANGKKAQRLAKKAAKAAPKTAKAVAPAKGATKPAAKGKPVAAKAPAKKTAVITKKTAAKPVAKVAAKAPAKSVAKPVAKKPVKAAAKPVAKAGVVTRKARKA